MLNSSRFTRSAAIAAAVISLGASPAMARPSDQPVRPTVANHIQQWTQPRIDASGVRPAVSAAPAVPLTRAADTSGGADWLLISIAAATLLALLAIVAVVHPVRHRADSLHAR